MIIYNVTCNVEKSISEEWLRWMKKVHIPKVMECGLFASAQINKVITSSDDGVSYAIQYNCSSIKDLHQYQIQCSSDLQQEHSDRYGTKVVAFRTMLEVIERF